MKMFQYFLRTRDPLRIIAVALVGWYSTFAALHQDSWHVIDNVNLVIHEAGHTIFFFLGEFLDIAAGSGFQVLVPAVFIGYFFLRREFFSSSLLLFWFGESLVNVSIYAGDALKMELPLLGGDGTIHDWNYLLGHVGLLGSAPLVSFIIFMCGALSLCAGLILGVRFAVKQKSGDHALANF